MSTNPNDASQVHPEAYYDDHGRLIKQCWCGKEGVFGYGVSLRQGKFGTHYCSEHWPDRPLPATAETTKPPPKPLDLQALVAKHGGYDRIPPEAWAEWDRQNALFQAQRRNGK